jgi:hypothetical protein
MDGSDIKAMIFGADVADAEEAAVAEKPVAPGEGPSVGDA